MPLGSCSALGYSRVMLCNSAPGWRICPRSFLLTVSPQLPGGFSCLADMAPGRCSLRTTGILSTIGSSACLQGIMAPGGPSSSSLLLPRKEKKRWSRCSLTPDSLARWRGTGRNVKPLSHAAPTLPPRASICLGPKKLHPTLKCLPAHRPPSHRRDIPAPGRDLALNGCRESCLLEIHCLPSESCSLQSLESDTL